MPRTEERFLSPPDEFLVLCSVESPPEKEAFLKLSLEERVAVLGKKYMQQTKNVGKCNLRLIDLNKWIVETKARIASKGKGE